MEQIIYEQAFKEHCVTSNNKMKGKKHLKWVALFRRHASSSKAVSLRKTVNSLFFCRPARGVATGGQRVRRACNVGRKTSTSFLVGTDLQNGGPISLSLGNGFIHSNIAFTKRFLSSLFSKFPHEELRSPVTSQHFSSSSRCQEPANTIKHLQFNFCIYTCLTSASVLALGLLRDNNNTFKKSRCQLKTNAAFPQISFTP